MCTRKEEWNETVVDEKKRQCIHEKWNETGRNDKLKNFAAITNVCVCKYVDST